MAKRDLTDEEPRMETRPRAITGEIIAPVFERSQPRPGRAHGRAAKQCLRALGPYDVENGGRGWWILAEHEFVLPVHRYVVPDIAGFRVESTPVLPDDNPLPALPDFVCEVLSPDTAHDDRNFKLPLYAHTGVSWVWMVNPELRTVEVFECTQGAADLTLAACGDETIVLPPFDAPVALASWWLPPTRDSRSSVTPRLLR